MTARSDLVPRRSESLFFLLLVLSILVLIASHASAGVEHRLKVDAGSGAIAQFGYGVASGDWDGDGVPDVAVSGLGMPGGNLAKGQVVLYSVDIGSSPSSTEIGRINRTTVFSGTFGQEVAFSKGFVTGAGDALVVARRYATVNELFVYVASPDSHLTTTLDAETCLSTDYFGASVAGGGDFDGDGIDDIAVGAPATSGVGVPGSVSVFLGGNSTGATVDATYVFFGEASGDEFGTDVAFLPDMNDDGKDELIVVARRNASGTYGGKAYVLAGRSSAADFASLGWTGTSCGALSSETPIVAVVGGSQTSGTDYTLHDAVGLADHNGDQVPDLVVGGSTAVGVFYLSGSTSGVLGFDEADVIVQGSGVPIAEVGTPLANAGDINGDGLSDLVIGSGAAESTDGLAGVLLGCVTRSSTIDFDDLDVPLATPESSSDLADDQFGFAVASAGDLNEDGIDELVIGAPTAGPGVDGDSEDSGAVYVFENVLSLFENESTASGLTFGGTPYTTIPVDLQGSDDVIRPGLLVTREGSGPNAKVFVARQNSSSSVPIFTQLSNIEAGDTIEDFRGAAAADVDNDGFAEVFLAHATYPTFLVYHPGSTSTTDSLRNQSGRIRKVDNTTTVNQSWAASFADYDRDGWVDLAVGRAGDTGTPAGATTRDVILMRNRGFRNNDRFRDVTSAAGLSGSATASHSVAWMDVDGDRWPELFVGSLSDTDDSKLYENDGDGTFTTVSTGDFASLTHVSGISFGDVDADGDQDLLIARREASVTTNVLVYTNVQSLTSFPDSTLAYDLEEAQKSLSIAPIDLELNGTIDVIVNPESGGAMRLWRNPGTGAEFTDVLLESGLDDGVSGTPGTAGGVAIADFNDDGDFDIVFARATSSERFFQNTSGTAGDDPSSVWIGVRLEGGDGNNRSGIGARVEILVDSETIAAQVVDGGSGRGEQKSNRLRFGLGSYGDDVTVRVTWPDGYVSTVDVDAVDLGEEVVVYDDHELDWVGSMTVTPTQQTGAKTDWTFKWKTDYSCPAYADTILVAELGTSVFPTTTLTLGVSGVSVTVEKTAAGYEHTLVATGIPCVPGSSFRFRPVGWVESWDLSGTSPAIEFKSAPGGNSVTVSAIPACLY